MLGEGLNIPTHVEGLQPLGVHPLAVVDLVTVLVVIMVVVVVVGGYLVAMAPHCQVLGAQLRLHAVVAASGAVLGRLHTHTHTHTHTISDRY